MVTVGECVAVTLVSAGYAGISSSTPMVANTIATILDSLAVAFFANQANIAFSQSATTCQSQIPFTSRDPFSDSLKQQNIQHYEESKAQHKLGKACWLTSAVCVLTTVVSAANSHFAPLFQRPAASVSAFFSRCFKKIEKSE